MQSETQQFTEITFDVKAGHESFDFVGFRFTQPNLHNSTGATCYKKGKVISDLRYENYDLSLTMGNKNILKPQIIHKDFCEKGRQYLP